MCSQRQVTPTLQPRNSMIAGDTTRRSLRASLRIIERAREKIKTAGLWPLRCLGGDVRKVLIEGCSVHHYHFREQAVWFVSGKLNGNTGTADTVSFLAY